MFIAKLITVSHNDLFHLDYKSVFFLTNSPRTARSVTVLKQFRDESFQL